MKWNGNNKYIQFKAKWRDGFRWWPSCAFYWWPSSLMACPSKILPVQVNSRNHEINFHQRRSISSYLVSTKKPPPEMIENSGNTRYDFKSTCKSLWNDEMHYRRDDELEVFSSQGHWKISKSFTLNQSILLASTVQKIKILSQENIGESRKKWKKRTEELGPDIFEKLPKSLKPTWCHDGVLLFPLFFEHFPGFCVRVRSGWRSNWVTHGGRHAADDRIDNTRVGIGLDSPPRWRRHDVRVDHGRTWSYDDGRCGRTGNRACWCGCPVRWRYVAGNVI